MISNIITKEATRFGHSAKEFKSVTRTRLKLKGASPSVSIDHQLNTYESAKQFHEALMTVRLIGSLLERAPVELFEAKGAHEMVRMPFPAQSGDAAACHRLATGGADGASLQVIVMLTEGLTIQFEVLTANKFHSTVLQKKEL